MQRDSSNFEMDAICAVLSKFGVEYVMIGGAAAIYQALIGSTRDFNLVPSPAGDNLTRLTEALLDLDSEVSLAGKVRGFPDGQWLTSSRTWNFETGSVRSMSCLRRPELRNTPSCLARPR